MQISLVEKAKELALNAHKGQMYGENPYSVHLEEVVGVLYELGHEKNSELIAAAWLHDVVEDTPITLKDLVSMGFTIYTVALVDAVTNAEGGNRKERHSRTYPRIRRLEEAVLLKLADRIVNVRHCIKDNKKSLLKMYISEWYVFCKELYTANSNCDAWDILKDLFVDSIDKNS